MTTSLTFDLWRQSRGQEAITEKCDLSYNQVWEPLWRFGWSLLKAQMTGVMGQWVCVTVIAQINTCSSSGAQSPKTLLAGSAVFMGQGTVKCWPLLIRETNWRELLHTGLIWGSQSLSSALKKKAVHVPNAWNCLLHKAAPSVLLFTLISDSLKRCCILLLSLFWISFMNWEPWIESLVSSVCKCHFQSEMKQSSFL